jgi:hypothetical protein
VSASTVKVGVSKSFTLAVFCMALLISMKCVPSPFGKSEVRNGVPLMVRVTAVRPFASSDMLTSGGIWTQLQPPLGSIFAWKVFVTGLFL